MKNVVEVKVRKVSDLEEDFYEDKLYEKRPYVEAIIQCNDHFVNLVDIYGRNIDIDDILDIITPRNLLRLIDKNLNKTEADFFKKMIEQNDSKYKLLGRYYKVN